MIESAISMLSSISGIHAWLTAIRTGKKSQDLLDNIESLSARVDKLSDEIIYASSVIEVRTKAEDQVSPDKESIKAMLEPIQEELGQSILSTKLSLIPQETRELMQNKPWDILFDIRPLKDLRKPRNPDLIPVIFNEGGKVYVGWQTKAALDSILNISIEDLNDKNLSPEETRKHELEKELTNGPHRNESAKVELPPEQKNAEVEIRLNAFICHAAEDKPIVRKLYTKLKEDKVNAWLDEEKILPGQDWRLVIDKAIRKSDVVLVCLSRRSVTKTGYIQKELKVSLELLDEQPEGAIFLIPLRLEQCEVPQKLQHLHFVDVNHERGYQQLLLALRKRAEQLGQLI